MNQPVHPNKRKAGAGASGAGLGTIVAYIAQRLPDTNEFRAPLLLAAPTIAVGFSALVFFGYKQARIIWTDLQIGRAQRKLDKITNSRLNDKNTSEEYKTMLRRKVEEYEVSAVDTQIQRIKKLSENYDNLSSE